MSLKVNRINNISLTNTPNNTTSNDKQSFTSKPDENPISVTGERMKITTATFIGGLGIGVKLLAELLDGDFVFEKLAKNGEKIVERNHKSASKTKKAWLSVASTLGLAGILIGGFALLYTIYNAPKIAYKGKVNAFTKGKDMDVYIKGNEAEKEILTQMNDKAIEADNEEKAKLKEQYMQMQMAKNRVPDFIKLKNK